MADSGDQATELFRRVLLAARSNEAARVDALAALAMKRLWAPLWPERRQYIRTVTSPTGVKATPLFTGVDALRTAALKFGWRNADGNVACRELPARDAVHHAVAHGSQYIVFDLCASHSVQFSREEVEPLISNMDDPGGATPEAELTEAVRRYSSRPGPSRDSYRAAPAPSAEAGAPKGTGVRTPLVPPAADSEGGAPGWVPPAAPLPGAPAGADVDDIVGLPPGGVAAPLRPEPLVPGPNTDRAAHERPTLKFAAPTAELLMAVASSGSKQSAAAAVQLAATAEAARQEAARQEAAAHDANDVPSPDGPIGFDLAEPSPPEEPVGFDSAENSLPEVPPAASSQSAEPAVPAAQSLLEIAQAQAPDDTPPSDAPSGRPATTQPAVAPGKELPAADDGAPAAAAAQDSELSITDETLDAISDALRQFPEVEWAACMPPPKGKRPDEVTPVVALRIEPSFVERAEEISALIVKTGKRRGEYLEVDLLEAMDRAKQARRVGTVFFPGRHRSNRHARPGGAD